MMDHGTADSADCKVSMLWNWYTVDACFLSTSWQITNNGMMAASCIGIVLLVMSLEVLRLLMRRLDTMILTQMKRRGNALLAASQSAMDSSRGGCPGASPPTRTQNKIVMRVSPLQQVMRAVLYAVMVGVAYVIMLLAMYFNGYVLISIIIGAGLGKFLCDWLEVVVVISEEEDGEKNRPGEIEELTVCCQ